LIAFYARVTDHNFRVGLSESGAAGWTVTHTSDFRSILENSESR
jgi:hypothetical protein